MIKPLVLLVEDDQDTATLYSAMLSAEGFEVVSCQGSGQARNWWASSDRRPAVVVLDVRLPDGNGLDLCDDLCREGGDLPAPPVLVLSAHGDPRLPLRCRQAGAQAFLDKVSDLDKFVQKVKELHANTRE